MNTIPVEIYVQIFDYLPGAYLFISKMVSKQWATIISTCFNHKLDNQRECSSILHKYLEDLVIEDDEKILSLVLNQVPELWDWIRACAIHYGSTRSASLFTDTNTGAMIQAVEINHNHVRIVEHSFIKTLLHHVVMSGNMRKLESIISNYAPVDGASLVKFMKHHWILILSNCYLDMIKFMEETSGIIFNGFRHKLNPSPRWSEAIEWFHEKNLLHLLVPSIAALGDRDLIKLLMDCHSDRDLVLSGLLHSENLPLVQEFCNNFNLESFQYHCNCIPFTNENFPVVEWIYPFLNRDSKDSLITCIYYVGEINNPSFMYWILDRATDMDLRSFKRLCMMCIQAGTWNEVRKLLEEKYINEQKIFLLGSLYLTDWYYPLLLFSIGTINWNKITINDLKKLNQLMRKNQLVTHLLHPNTGKFIKDMQKSFHKHYQIQSNNYESVTFSDGTKIYYLGDKKNQMEKYLDQMVQYETKRHKIIIGILFGLMIIIIWVLYYLLF